MPFSRGFSQPTLQEAFTSQSRQTIAAHFGNFCKCVFNKLPQIFLYALIGFCILRRPLDKGLYPLDKDKIV